MHRRDDFLIADDDIPDEPQVQAPMHRGRGRNAAARNLEAEGLTPDDGKAWLDARHQLHTTRYLTADDPRAPTPPGFKGELYPPQQTLLAAMCALEMKPYVSGDGHHEPVIQANRARVCEQPSFGKTVLALALVCAQPVPRRLPEALNVCGSALAHANDNRAFAPAAPGVRMPWQSGGFLPCVQARYRRFLQLTVVAATANVISQWEGETRRFTDLRHFTIEHVRSLREFEKQYRAGEVAVTPERPDRGYHLLFIKIGRVTANFQVAGEKKDDHSRKANRSLFEALHRVLEGVPVARMIVDDYDMAKLLNDDCYLPALYTWLISATRRQTNIRPALQTDHTSYDAGGNTVWLPFSVQDYFRANGTARFPILGSALDDVLNKAFSLRCAPDYVGGYISTTQVAYRRVCVQGGRVAAMMRALEVPDELVEMVNADAVGTAAQALGLQAKSAADVLRRVMGTHLDKVRGALRSLARVAQAFRALARKPQETDREKVKDLRAKAKDGTDEEFAAALRLCGGGPEARAALESLEEAAQKQRDEHSAKLNRMRDNVREGACQCCMLPFDAGSPAYVLAGCCQIIVCEPCIVVERGGARRQFISRCPNCARDVDAAGLVRVGGELDLEAALADDSILAVEGPLAAEVEVAAPAVAPAAPAAPVPEAEAAQALLNAMNPKLKALMQFVRREPIDCISDGIVPPFVGRLLAGRRDAPWPDARPRKLMIFTMHPESTHEIERALTAVRVPYRTLRGSRAQKDQVVEDVRDDPAVGVMLVTAAKDCAGLNMPFLSHILYFHLTIDRNVETQVAGRGQRLGREYNLTVVAFHNEAEAAQRPM